MASEEDKAKLKAKNKKVKDNVAAYAPDGGPFAVATRYGQVAFERIDVATDADGVEYLEIYLLGDTENGDPHWRIYNPPTWVRDPNGPITGRGGVKKFREDPIVAVAEAIGRRGGRQKVKRA